MKKNQMQHHQYLRANCGNAIVFLVVLVVIVAGLLAVGILPKLSNNKVLSEKEKEVETASHVVSTVKVVPAPQDESIVVPGNIGAMQYATIYSRVDGYLKNRVVDIGDSVKEGQLIAEIDTPTIDEEIAQAKADLAQAKGALESAKATLKESKAKSATASADVRKSQADQSYAATTAERWNNMASQGAVSLQSRDERDRSLAAQNAALDASRSQEVASKQAVEAAAAQVKVAMAGIESRQAALNRYQAQQSFKYIRAPFSGVITLRKVDPGALITAGSQTSTTELFQLAKLDVLRIYVDAPQNIASYLSPGLKAELTSPSFPGRTFEGTITNVSGALDPNTRTRQTEIKIENPKHELLPGMYAQVKLTAPRPDSWVKVPSNAVVQRNGDMEVFVVQNGKAILKKVIIGRDFGDEIEIRAGLAPNDEVVISAPDDLADNDPVQTKELAAK